MNITHIAPKNAEAIPIQFPDGEQYMYLPGQDGMAASGDGYIATNDGTGSTIDPTHFGHNPLAAMFEKANDNGLTGQPFTLQFPTITESRKWATEFNMFRAALFEQASAKKGFGIGGWAVCSDQFPITVNNNTLATGLNANYMLADVDYVFDSSASGGQDVAVSCLGGFTFSQSLGSGGVGQSFGFLKLVSEGNLGDALTAYTVRINIPLTSGTALPAVVFSGRTDLLNITRTLQGNTLVISGNAKPNLTLQAVETIWLSIDSITGRTVSGGAGCTVSFQRRDTQTIATSQSQEGGNAVNVIDPSGGTFVRLHPKAEAMKTKTIDGTEIKVTTSISGARVAVQLAWNSSIRTGIWLARSAPVAFFNYESIVGESELWKYVRHNQFYYGEYKWTNCTDAPVNANSATIRAPHAHGYDDFIDVDRSDSWPGFDEIAVTVPAAPEVATTFQLPAYRISNHDRYGQSTTCQYYKIPLPMLTREQEHRVKWFQLTGQTPGAPLQNPEPYQTEALLDPYPMTVYWDGLQDNHSADGTTAQDYFPQARLTSADGLLFWWKDIIERDAREINPNNSLLRWRHWFIGPDGTGYALYLLLDQRDVTVDRLPDGTPITGTVDYWPQETISHEKYKAAYGMLWDRFHGNWHEFNPPFVDTTYRTEEGESIPCPIPAWTVGRTSGPKFTAGMQLKLHVPRKLSRAQLTDYTPKQLDFLDITHVRDFSGLASYSMADRRSMLYDFSIWRQPHKWQVLQLNGGKSVLNYWPALDLRLYTVSQLDTATIGTTPNPENWADDFRVRDYYKARLISPDEYTVDDDGNIEFAGWDDEIVLASYQTRKHTSNPITVRVGNITSGGNPTFTEFDRYTFTGQRKATPYVNVESSIITKQKPWLINKVWPIAFKRVENPVACSLDVEAVTYSIAGKPDAIAGIVATVTVPEDSTVRYRAQWQSKDRRQYLSVKTMRDWSLYSVSGSTVMGPGLYGDANGYSFQWFKTDGTQLTPSIAGSVLTLKESGVEIANQYVIEQLDETVSQECPALMGDTVIPWKFYREDGKRMASISIISCVQNFAVKIAGRELFPNPSVGATISGTAFKFHYNETKRMLDAWIENK